MGKSSLRRKILILTILTLFFCFSAVQFFGALNAEALLAELLKVNGQVTDDISAGEVISTRDQDKSIVELHQKEYQRRCNELIIRDRMTLRPLMLENSVMRVRQILADTASRDDDVILASFYTLDNSYRLKLWQLVTSDYPLGLDFGSVYDPTQLRWVGTYQGKEVSVIDARASDIAEFSRAQINIVRYQLEGHSVEAYECTAVVFDETKASPEQVIFSGDQVGYLRYVLSLEKVSQLSANKSDALSEIQNKLRTQGERMAKKTSTLATSYRLNSSVYQSILGFMIFLMAIGFSLFTTQGIFRPLKPLLEGVHQLASGNMQHRVHVDRKDEFGSLARSFNDMITCLEQVIKEREEKAALESEVSAAEIIQAAFVPKQKEFPGMDIEIHYQVASKAGGDWQGLVYDSETHCLFFFVGDVAGHGIPSALLTGVAHGSLYTQAGSPIAHKAGLVHPDKKLRLFAETLNRVFLDAARGEKELTMAFIAIELENGKGYYINAGHPPIIIVRQSSEAQGVKQISDLGSSIGHDLNFTWKLKEFNLEPGDMIVTYSDGLIENFGPQEQVFDIYALKAVLEKCREPKEVIAKTIAEAEKFWQAEQPQDDVTLAALKWLYPISRSEFQARVMTEEGEA